MHCWPAVAARRLSVEGPLEGIEAHVPAGGIARGLALLAKRVEQAQNAPAGCSGDLQPDDVGAPPELHEMRRFERQHFTLEVTVVRDEAERRPDAPLAHDALRKPRVAVLGFDDRPPHSVGRVTQVARKAQAPALAGAFENTSHW